GLVMPASTMARSFRRVLPVRPGSVVGVSARVPWRMVMKTGLSGRGGAGTAARSVARVGPGGGAWVSSDCAAPGCTPGSGGGRGVAGLAQHHLAVLGVEGPTCRDLDDAGGAHPGHGQPLYHAGGVQQPVVLPQPVLVVLPCRLEVPLAEELVVEVVHAGDGFI